MNKWNLFSFCPLFTALFVFLFLGCSQKQDDFARQKTAKDLQTTEELINFGEDIKKPYIPEALAAEASQLSSANSLVPDKNAPTTDTNGKPVTKPLGINYSVSFIAEDTRLINALEKVSVLVSMEDTEVDTFIAITRRMQTDLDNAQKILTSYGYYAGNVHAGFERINTATPTASSTANPAVKQVPINASDTVLSEEEQARQTRRAERIVQGDTIHITITFFEGPAYTIGTTKIMFLDASQQSAENPRAENPLPRTLEFVNLTKGSPAEAPRVLNAVDDTKRYFQDRGYPYALVNNSRYIVDHEKHTLDVTTTMRLGALTRMGSLIILGSSTVNPNYLQSLQNWKENTLWNKTLVDEYRIAIRQGGLFRAVDIGPSDETSMIEGAERRDIVVSLDDAPHRTIGGALKFDTDFGPGLYTYWENRSYTDNGDKLRAEASIWKDLQEITTAYRLPFFLHKNQTLLINAGAKNEESDAYDTTAAIISAGLERRYGRRWTATLMGALEGGELQDPDQPKYNYYMVSAPFSVRYDKTNDMLNPERGFRILASLTPATGDYNGAFSALRSRLDASVYLPVDKSLVLALRASFGHMMGADSTNVPPSLRFYGGGGGSVRGYSYQSLGPRNKRDDPLGGDRVQEYSAELRWKYTDEWGFVSFVDAGMVQAGGDNPLKEDLQWAAGVGIRYYTAIGPVRFDIATPLNPREDDKSFHIYISIGQSF